MANRYVWNGPMTGHTTKAAKSTRLTHCIDAIDPLQD